MKKFIILFALMLSLVGCANGNTNTNTEAEVPKTDNVTPLEEEEPEEPEEQVSDKNYLDPCEICGKDGYTYHDNNNKEHIYCVDHWLEALDNEPKPDNDILIVDLPEEHCAICGDYGEHYFPPSDIWLCDDDWGDWNSYDEE